MNNQRTYQIYLRASFPEENSICLKATSEESISTALLSLINMLFQSLAERGHIDISACRDNNLTKYLKAENHPKEKTKEDFVRETLEILQARGWGFFACSDFLDIAQEEYSEYINVVEELLPNGTALYRTLKEQFDLTLSNPKRGVQYRYMTKIIASISAVSASRYHQKESEESPLYCHDLNTVI